MRMENKLKLVYFCVINGISLCSDIPVDEYQVIDKLIDKVYEVKRVEDYRGIGVSWFYFDGFDVRLAVAEKVVVYWHGGC